MTPTYICRYCKKEKELDSNNFKIERRTKLGFDTVCRPCRRHEKKTLREKNKSVFLEREKKYRNTEWYKKYHKTYYYKNKEYLNDSAKKRYENNPIPYLNRAKQQKVRLGKKYSEYQKKYRIKNRKQLSKYSLHRYHTNIRVKLSHLISGGIRKKLNGKIKNSRSIEYIGCSWEFLIGYLESKFKNDMNWNNFGKLWHIDHIIPCAAFDFSDEKQIKKCFNYTNLQPLLASENVSKQDRMPDGTLGRYIKNRLT